MMNKGHEKNFREKGAGTQWSKGPKSNNGLGRVIMGLGVVGEGRGRNQREINNTTVLPRKVIWRPTPIEAS